MSIIQKIINFYVKTLFKVVWAILNHKDRVSIKFVDREKQKKAKKMLLDMTKGIT